jgi:hypothetical protein
MRTFTQAQLFDDEWCVDEIEAQPDPASAAAMTVRIAAERLAARRRRQFAVVKGGKR